MATAREDTLVTLEELARLLRTMENPPVIRGRTALVRWASRDTHRLRTTTIAGSRSRHTCLRWLREFLEANQVMVWADVKTPAPAVHAGTSVRIGTLRIGTTLLEMVRSESGAETADIRSAEGNVVAVRIPEWLANRLRMNYE